VHPIRQTASGESLKVTEICHAAQDERSPAVSQGSASGGEPDERGADPSPAWLESI